jgi:hypothetical protein
MAAEGAGKEEEEAGRDHEKVPTRERGVLSHQLMREHPPLV